MKKLVYLILVCSLFSCEHTTTTTVTERTWSDELRDTVTVERTTVVKEYNEESAADNAATVITATGLLVACSSLWR